MRYMTMIFALLMVLPFAASADEIFHEEFDTPSGWIGSGNPPDGWTIYDDGYPAANDWHQYAYGGGNIARIYWSPSEYDNEDVLVKYDIDCGNYYNIELSYWVDLNWYCYGGYYGYFYVVGSTDSFSFNWNYLLTNWWSSQIYSTTMSHNIGDWADYEDSVSLAFWLYIDDTYGLNWIYLDEVHLEGDLDTVIQPTSLGKIKAMYE